MEGTFKILFLIVIMCVCLISVNFSNFSHVLAVENAPILQVNGSDNLDGNYFVFKNENGDIIGKVGIRLDQSDTYLTPSGNAVTLTGVTIGDNIRVDFIPSTGYEINGSVFIGGSSIPLPGAEPNGTRSLGIDITSQVTIVDNISFQLIGQDPDPNPGSGPQEQEIYEIAAYFEGVQAPVVSDIEGNIPLPQNWTNGEVTFFVRTCKVNGTTSPYHDGMQCDPGSYEEVRIDIVSAVFALSTIIMKKIN